MTLLSTTQDTPMLLSAPPLEHTPPRNVLFTMYTGRPGASVFLGAHQAHQMNMAAAQRFQVHPMFHAHLNTAGRG